MPLRTPPSPAHASACSSTSTSGFLQGSWSWACPGMAMTTHARGWKTWVRSGARCSLRSSGTNSSRSHIAPPGLTRAVPLRAMHHCVIGHSCPPLHTGPLAHDLLARLTYGALLLFRGVNCSDAAGLEVPFRELRGRVHAGRNSSAVRWDWSTQSSYYNYATAGGEVHQVGAQWSARGR